MIRAKNNIVSRTDRSIISIINSLSQSRTQKILQIDGNTSLVESIDEDVQYACHIPVILNFRSEKLSDTTNNGSNSKNLITVKRNNKLLEASYLPVVINLNPRSLYNKKEEFKTLIEQSEAGICCISESWDRSHTANSLLLSDAMDIEGYRWVKNVQQRSRKGGKPAILISESEFHITELCSDVITVPKSVKIVWSLLTPKVHNKNMKFRHIVAASAYYSSTETRKAD